MVGNLVVEIFNFQFLFVCLFTCLFVPHVLPILQKENGQLRRHVEQKHLGITYRCDECDYQTRAKEDLGVHVKVKHLGFKYTCV